MTVSCDKGTSILGYVTPNVDTNGIISFPVLDLFGVDPDGDGQRNSKQ